MASKTFKIGEYCKGGIITAQVKGQRVAIIAKEWDNSAGYSKNSDQSKAKEWDRLEVEVIPKDQFIGSHNSNVHRDLDFFLCDLTTSYHADQVMKWIESKVDFNLSSNW